MSKIDRKIKLPYLFKTFCLLQLIIYLGACSTTRELVDTPNIIIKNGTFPETRNHAVKPSIIFVTDRKPKTKKNGFSYSSNRSSSMAFGLAEVSFEGANNWLLLEAASTQSDRDKDIDLSLTKVTELSQFPETPIPFKMVSGNIVEDSKQKRKYQQETEKLQNLIREQLKKSPVKEALIYIHGFNASFREAVFDIVDVWHFTGRHGVPLLYSWPAGVGGLFGYFTDRESGEFTIFHLKEFLRIVRDISEIEKLHIIAHSRGTDIMTSALRELIIESKASGKNPFKEYRIASLTLAAPDLDFEVVRQRLIAEKFAQGFGQINIYTNSADGALGIAQNLMSGTRFGKLKVDDLGKNETEIFKEIRHVNFINVTGVKGFFGHSYHREHPGALSDIIQVITKDAFPGDPERPLINKGGNFWGLKGDYLIK